MKRPLRSVNIEDIAKYMKEAYGIDPQKLKADNFDGWTEAFCDTLEQLYDLEYLVLREITK